METIKQALNLNFSGRNQSNKAIVILPYSPKTDLEVELEIGDYVIFEKQYCVDEEWVHGKVVSEVRGEHWALVPRHCVKFI